MERYIHLTTKEFLITTIILLYIWKVIFNLMYYSKGICGNKWDIARIPYCLIPIGTGRIIEWIDPKPKWIGGNGNDM